MQRDRSQTERKLIDAVGYLIAQEGLISVGINRVARQSGVNKVLIYRYFGSIDGLIQAYYRRNQSWLTIPIADLAAFQTASVSDFFNQFHPALTSEVRQLQNNPEAQALLRAELCNPNPLGLSQPSATIYQPLADALAHMVGGSVGRAYAAILINGLVMLSLQRTISRPKTDLSDSDSWEQVEAAIQLIFQGTSRLLEDRQQAG